MVTTPGPEWDRDPFSGVQDEEIEASGVLFRPLLGPHYEPFGPIMDPLRDPISPYILVCSHPGLKGRMAAGT